MSKDRKNLVNIFEKNYLIGVVRSLSKIKILIVTIKALNIVNVNKYVDIYYFFLDFILKLRNFQRLITIYPSIISLLKSGFVQILH